MRSNNETHKFSGQSTAALLSNKIANVLTVSGTLVQAPSSKVKRKMKKSPKKAMFAQQTFTGRRRRLAPNLQFTDVLSVLECFQENV